jgi:hypothetical protein
MESLFREIAHATKLLWKDRGFAATVILTLAVCIGANAAIFTVVNSVLLRPLPVPEAGRILVMSNQYPGAGVPETFSNSIPDYLERRLAMTAFEEQATFRFDDYTIDVDGTPGLLIGMVPLARLSRINLSTALREDSRSGTGRRSRTVRRGLVVAQVGLAFMLLIGAGLLFASFRQLLAVDPGFKPERVVTVSIAAPGTKYPQPVDIRRFFDRTLESIRALPGVVAAGGTTAIPFSGRFDRNAILAEGYQFRPGESLVAPFQVTVTPGYFEAMATPLMRGRYFNERDTDTSPGVVIVDEKLARKFWGDADPIGRRMYEPGDDDLLKITEKTRWWTVVGVVRDVQLADLSGAQQAVGAYYFSATQSQQYTLTLAIKTALDPATLVKEGGPIADGENRSRHPTVRNSHDGGTNAPFAFVTACRNGVGLGVWRSRVVPVRNRNLRCPDLPGCPAYTRNRHSHRARQQHQRHFRARPSRRDNSRLDWRGCRSCRDSCVEGRDRKPGLWCPADGPSRPRHRRSRPHRDRVSRMCVARASSHTSGSGDRSEFLT